MYQVEHDEMFAAIRAGKPINNGEYAASSTLLAIMGRDGRLHRRGHHLGDGAELQGGPRAPTKFAWGDAPVRPVPRPGVTKFV